MPAVDTLEILKSAKEERRGIGAFNVVNFTQIIAIKDVAEVLKYPLLIQTSVATASFYSPELIVSVFREIAESSNIPMALHLDHCREINFAKRCVKAGYSSIMVDFSKEPYNENVKKTEEVVRYCKKLGNIAVEGEVGIIPGVEDNISFSKKDEILCTPEVALDFIKKTDVDLFAPAIGTAHGIYKTDNPKIDFERLKNIDDFLKNNHIFVPLVIHGCSGLSENIVRKLIKYGASKFNVSTDIKQRVLRGIRDHLNRDIHSNNTLELEKIVKRETFEEVKRWVSIFVANYSYA